ncbi:hypothetical protein Q7P35_000569 [Cladosporium inversicolor]
MLAESLHRLGARPDTLILYATSLDSDTQADASSARLLQQATQMYGARVQPVEVLNSPSSKADSMWSQGFTKLLAFNQTRYKRVLSLDSDATLLQPMDELFLLPAESKVAMPRAYWLEDKLCAAVMLASPSEFEFGRIQARLRESQPEEYDMEIINAFGEMRAKSHEAYLGFKEEPWDVDSVMKQAKYVHFSDWPVPNPWVGTTEAMKLENQPGCKPPGEQGVACWTAADGEGVGGELRLICVCPTDSNSDKYAGPDENFQVRSYSTQLQCHVHQCGVLSSFLELKRKSLTEAAVVCEDTTCIPGRSQEMSSSYTPRHLEQSTIVAIYKVNYVYTLIAVGCVYLEIVLVFALLRSWKRLGREFSMSPLEIAKAFNAPILENIYSNSTGAQISRASRRVMVRYGGSNETAAIRRVTIRRKPVIKDESTEIDGGETANLTINSDTATGSEGARTLLIGPLYQVSAPVKRRKTYYG